MRLISLVIGLVIIGYLLSKQLAPSSTSSDINEIIDKQNTALPKVPVAPEDLKGFETDMNKFIHDTASERNKELEKAEETLK